MRGKGHTGPLTAQVPVGEALDLILDAAGHGWQTRRAWEEGPTRRRLTRRATGVYESRLLQAGVLSPPTTLRVLIPCLRCSHSPPTRLSRCSLPNTGDLPNSTYGCNVGSFWPSPFGLKNMEPCEACWPPLLSHFSICEPIAQLSVVPSEAVT